MNWIHASIVVIATLAGCTALAAPPSTQPTSPPVEGKPTLYLVGDSTVRVGTKGQQGWGDPLIPMFDASRIIVINKAIGGRSSRSFIQEGRWDEILKTLKPGDYVIIQMGHNDGGPLAGDNRERGSIRGIGDESKEVELTLGDNKGKKFTVYTYGHYLRQYVKDARAKGATPILCSWIPHCPRPGDAVKVPESLTSYGLFAKQVAEAENVPFIDIYTRTHQQWVDAGLTQEQIKAQQFTEADFTHTSPAGAAVNAKSVADGIRALDVPLKVYLLPETK
jgi:rhamnogalacturonan acetylesterase